jgi:hypothetical protein
MIIIITILHLVSILLKNLKGVWGRSPHFYVYHSMAHPLPITIPKYAASATCLPWTKRTRKAAYTWKRAVPTANSSWRVFITFDNATYTLGFGSRTNTDNEPTCNVFARGSSKKTDPRRIGTNRSRRVHHAVSIIVASGSRQVWLTHVYPLVTDGRRNVKVFCGSTDWSTDGDDDRWSRQMQRWRGVRRVRGCIWGVVRGGNNPSTLKYLRGRQYFYGDSE